MRELSETASTLAIHYPLWMGPLSLLVGHAVAGLMLKDRKGSVQRQSGRRGMQPHLVLRLAPRGETAIEISGIGPGEIERVVAFARERAARR